MKHILSILQSLKENDGATLRNYETITYKTGWQVATEGIETKSMLEAAAAIMNYKGNCGLWYFKGIYYVDKSQRVDTKCEALEIGRAHNQISILNWRTMRLAYC